MNLSDEKEDMQQRLSKENMRRLWEWQRYVKKETQRLKKKSTGDEERAEIVKPPLPKGPAKSSSSEKTQYPEVKSEEKTEHKPQAREISTKDLDKIESVEDVDETIDDLMSKSNDEEIEIDENLEKWIEPKAKSQTTVKKKPKEKAGKAPEPKTTHKPESGNSGGKSKTETLTLFNKEVEKARKKQRSPRKTREHLIENLLDPVISLDEAAVILNVCKTTVRRYTNSGKLECLRTPGNQRRFRLSDVLAFLEDKEGKKASRIDDEE